VVGLFASRSLLGYLAKENIMKKDMDLGVDLRVGDIVYIKAKIMAGVYNGGDVEIQYLPRNGYDEYAKKRINAIFLKRPKNKIIKWVVNTFAR
jgi:hypothetical protein